MLTPEEARALLRVPSPRAPTGIRNRALLAVLYRGGVRISEALALERRDLNSAACTLAVRHGKGDRHRTIGMDPAAFGLVARWLDERRRLGLSRPSAVFCTLDGHPHGLRHTWAAELAIEGVPVPLIQQQLGHASLHTTTIYLRHIAPVELVEKMRRRSWEP